MSSYVKKHSFSAWTEKGLFSKNAKNISIFSPIFALFSGLSGTTFSALIRLELSGPGAQGFVSLPLQSKINISSFIKHLTLANVITGLLIFIAFFLLRNYIFPNVYYPAKVRFLDEIPLEFQLNKDFLLGFLAVISRFSLKGFIEEFLAGYLSPNLLIADAELPPFMYQDKNPTGESSKPTPELIADTKRGQKIIDGLFVEGIKVEFDKFRFEMEKVAKSLKDRHEMFDQGKVTMGDLDVPNLLVMMLQDQTQFFNASILKRIEWTNVTRSNLPSDVRTELSTIVQNIFNLKEEHTNSIAKIARIKEEKQQVKEYFDLFNGYRNNVKKEISKLETVSRDGYRKHLPDLYKLKEFKQIVNVDAPKAIKEVVDQDGYLKSKISEIINAKKK